MRKKARTGQPMVKALACGLLEDNGRFLFLKRIDRYGTERIELPCVLVYSGRSPVAEIKTEFARQTGLDAEMHEIIFEARHNAGTRRRKNWVPCMVFKFTAKERKVKVSEEFSGFRWLSFDDAKKQKPARTLEWMRKALRKE